MAEIPHSYPASVLPRRWWETAAAIARPYLKFRGATLNDLAAALDNYQERGIDTLEIFAPFQGGVCYHGLDTLDYDRIDPALGTLEDYCRLVGEAHARGMAVILFINLGYGHAQFPAFLKACEDARAGIDSPETRRFLWSETGQDRMDRSLAPYFMNDSHGNWRWSERAGRYFWVKWEGERGGYHLPQFNFADPGWQAEVQRILRYWLATGCDGMVIDAVNWYTGCNWEICRSTMTGVLHAADNQLCQPEGAGGARRQLATSDDSRFYACLRGAGSERALAVFNFQPEAHSVTVDLAGLSIAGLEDLLGGERVAPAGAVLTLDLPAYGYRLYRVVHT